MFRCPFNISEVKCAVTVLGILSDHFVYQYTIGRQCHNGELYSGCVHHGDEGPALRHRGPPQPADPQGDGEDRARRLPDRRLPGLRAGHEGQLGEGHRHHHRRQARRSQVRSHEKSEKVDRFEMSHLSPVRRRGELCAPAPTRSV